MNQNLPTGIGKPAERSYDRSTSENPDALPLALCTQPHFESLEIVPAPIRIPVLFTSSGFAVPISTFP